jgi:ABC-type lipoprotein export system ATPase subunit
MTAEVGDVLTLHGRLDGEPVRARVTGLFQADRADDYFWQGDRLVTSGVERLDYTTYGPLVVAPATFVAVFGQGTFSAQWLVFPDCRAITSGRLGGLRARLDTLATDLRSGRTGHRFGVGTSLPDLVAQVNDALLVARSTMLIPVLQLVMLAGYALTLVARLIAEHRRMEVALLRARGASAGQLAVLTIGEGVLLTAPGAIAAPLLTGPLLSLAGSASVIRASGSRPDFAPSALTWSISIAAAVLCAVALTIPTLRGVTSSYVATRSARGRGERRGALQRAGADLALLMIAALGVWQLTRYGGPVTATTGAGARGGIDPLIVTGPALALLAGGLLVLRLVPIGSRALEGLTSRGRGLAPALGARQVSRRPLRHAGPVLLLVMAVAVGVLSVAAGSTWRRSQLEQADFQACTDLRVGVPAGTSGPLPLGGGRFASLPSVTTVGPVLRQQSVANEPGVILADEPTGELDSATSAVSFTVPTGQLLALRGRSGSGKTTLLNLVGGLDSPESGTVRVIGRDLTALGEHELLRMRRETLGFVFQSFGLIPVLSAAENVEVSLRLTRTAPRERAERVRVLLSLVGLADHADQRPYELSGGQQQRVAIARALANRPRLLIADEPTGQLDSDTAAAIMRLIRAVVRSEGVTALIATHDPQLISLADRVLELHDGALTADHGPPAGR